MSAYESIILFEPMISWFEGIEGCDEVGMLDYDNEDNCGILGEDIRFSESIIDLFEGILFGELIIYGASWGITYFDDDQMKYYVFWSSNVTLGRICSISSLSS